jgi:periplasmic protein TonB
MSTSYYPGVRDPMGKSFTGSLLAHGLIVALVMTTGLFSFSRSHFGDPNPSSGSVGVDMVKTIPIPRKEGPTNPLANDSTSVVPQEPAPVKYQKQVKAEPEKAIEIPDKTPKPKKLSPAKQVREVFKPPEPYKNNQVFSNTPQAANSPMYGMQGAGGIDVGKASVLGDRYGAYASLIRDRIGQHWNRANLHSSPAQVCTVTFTIQRTGSVTNVQISHPSGDYLLDTSAQRAILDSNPLPSLPTDFPRSEATVELNFQLKQ